MSPATSREPLAATFRRPAHDSVRHEGGVLLGFISVLAFSVTLPATRAAVPSLGVAFVGLGRPIVAAIFAAIYLSVKHATRPTPAEVKSLAVIALGVIFGFPLLAAVAMRTLPATHGAIVTGLIPCATALMAVWRAGERPRPLFWVGCAAGVLSVLVFAAVEGAGRPQLADLLLLLGVVGAALGYAEGTRLTRNWGPGSGILVISWVLVIGAPFAALLLGIRVAMGEHLNLAGGTPRAWVAFAYLSLVSAYLGFFPWYAALARGGVARVGQVQLIQPVLTVGWASLLLGEVVSARVMAAAVLVVASTALSVTGRARPVVRLQHLS